MVTLTINGKKVKAQEGATVLEAARAAGIEIPTLCHNDALEPYGSCRLCIVEIAKGKRSVVEASCTYPVEEGLAVQTNSQRVIEGRKLVIELLLARCPNVKRVQDLAKEYSVAQPANEWNMENDYCVLCGLCVRACNEVVGAGAIQFAGRGADRVVDSPFHKSAEDCIACGSCAFVCPTGIIKKNDLDTSATCSPEGTKEEGPKREILNWQVEYELKKCMKCGNPYAPVKHLTQLEKQFYSLPNFFNYCPSCRKYIVVDKDKCLGCGSCMENCPVGALELDDQGGYEKYAQVYTKNCMACHTCERYCPAGAIS
ncbi:MAG: 4Fe-4S dicluster domain-containing protein [Deltaproteobacteria bacterium]|nr:4Fe-4S dicluster domain-containing protein [Deltaproteobacteria bacterium]